MAVSLSALVVSVREQQRFQVEMGPDLLDQAGVV